MIPIRDENPRPVFPYMTLFLILVNVGLFVYQVWLGDQGQNLLFRFGAIPWELTHFQDLADLPRDFRTPFPNIVTLATSQFFHGGILHLLGNMIYLWIFGDNVEALMGPFKFLGFYLTCGLVAGLTHVAALPGSPIPMVGASGALSGVLGAYFLKFPRAKVHVLIFLFIFIRVIRVPAIIALGFWFLLQVVSGFNIWGFGQEGVAWFAHIGGFVAGMILVFRFERKRR